MRFAVLDYLTEAGLETEVLGGQAEVVCLQCRSEAELPVDLSPYVAVMLWHHVTLSEPSLRRFSACRAIVRVGVGYDNVDVAAAGRLGIPVVNVPDYGVDEVADHTLALLLALSRRLPVYDQAIRSDPRRGWNPDLGGEVHRLTGAVLGLVGLGRIGTAVAGRARAFGLTVAVYDPYLPNGLEKALQVRRCESRVELARMSDILSLHAPLTPETRGLIDAELLAEARPGLILINTARGGIVVLDAVYEALLSGRLRAFGADVLETEPPDPAHPLIRAHCAGDPRLHGRVLLTPHAGFYAEESRREMRVKAAEQMLRAARGLPLRNCVNRDYLRQPSRTPIEPLTYLRM